MNDWFLGAMSIVVLLAVFGIGYAMGEVSVVNKCERINLFYFDKKIYDCQERK